MRITELEGELSTAEGERDTANLRIATLEDEATQAGIAKMTADAEIARLNTLIRPTYNNWVRSVNPDATADLTNPRSQFLQIAEKTISTVGVTKNEVFTLDFSAFTYGGESLGLDDNDGLAHFQEQNDDPHYSFYAGIFGTTDLGAPITDSSFSATWAGKVSHSNRFDENYIRNFDLKVTFNGTIGTLDAQLHVPFLGDFFIDGKFDVNGAITGYVHHTADLGGGEIIPHLHGTLSGIIGSGGAVGVFHSRNRDYGGGFVAVPTATGAIATACAGSNVDPICPDDFRNKVTVGDWTRSFATPLNTKPTAETQFLMDNGDGSLDTTGLTVSTSSGIATVRTLNMSTATYDGVPLGGDAADGIAHTGGFLSAGNRGAFYSYAGILAGTDLGAPLTQISGTARWNGSFVTSYNPFGSDFTLNITFNSTGGSIDVFAHSGFSTRNYLITGTFDKRGVISGSFLLSTYTNNDRTTKDTSRSEDTGKLSGLIGTEGAVGVFIPSESGGGTVYRGGFVANPTAISKAFCLANLDDSRCHEYVVNFSDWVANVNPDAKADLTNTRHQILQVKNGTLDTTGVTRCRDSDDTNESRCGAVGSRTAPGVINRNLNNSLFDGRRINGDINDGYATFGGYIGETFYRYAGILDSTDLGAPLTGDAGTSVQWNGVLGRDTDFVLTITFDATGGRLDAFINRSGYILSHRLQNARFDTGGVITGTVNYQQFTDDDPTQPIDSATDSYSFSGDSVLSGIIGQEGAVAVFAGAGGAGGFVASPTVTLDPNKINFADWAGTAEAPKTTVIDSAGTGTWPLLNGVASVVDSGFKYNFIQGLATLAGKGFDFTGTAFADATVVGDVLLLAENSPSGVAFSSVTGTGVTNSIVYAGLLPGTNLGAPITDPSTSAIWDAEFMAVLRRGRGTLLGQRLYSNPSFKMQVTFDGSAGTINSGTVSGNTFTSGQISVPYTIPDSATTGSDAFNIQGKFDSDGLLYGKVVFVQHQGIGSVLTGLIGVDGAVGALWISNNYNFYLAGGFVAKPSE